MNIKKIISFTGLGLLLVGVLGNLTTYAEYKDIAPFWQFQRVYFESGSWFDITIIIGIILSIISLFIKKK